MPAFLAYVTLSAESVHINEISFTSKTLNCKFPVACKPVMFIAEGPWRVAFELKFYPDPMLLREEATR